MSVKIAIAGGAGRMGITLLQETLAHPNTDLTAFSVREDDIAHSLSRIQRAGLAGIDDLAVSRDENLLQDAQAVIDFTTPAYSLRLAQSCAEQGIAFICGTTGFSAEQHAQLAALAKQTPIVWAPNMSLGVNLLSHLVEKAAAALDDSFDIEIFEMHHRFKQDAPSGTALALGEAAAKGRDVALKEKTLHAREGHTGVREEGTIGFSVARGGDVIGDHTVMLAGDGERIELTHKASNRHIYARGAVKAALWAQGKPPALYSMQDVLGLA